jgi:ribosome-binding factor A
MAKNRKSPELGNLQEVDDLVFNHNKMNETLNDERQNDASLTRESFSGVDFEQNYPPIGDLENLVFDASAIGSREGIPDEPMNFDIDSFDSGFEIPEMPDYMNVNEAPDYSEYAQSQMEAQEEEYEQHMADANHPGFDGYAPYVEGDVPQPPEPSQPEAPATEDPEAPAAEESEAPAAEDPEAPATEESVASNENTEMNDKWNDFSEEKNALEQKLDNIVQGKYEGIDDSILVSLGQERDEPANKQMESFLMTRDNMLGTTMSGADAYTHIAKYQMAELYLKEVEKSEEYDKKMQEILGSTLRTYKQEFEELNGVDEDKAIALLRRVFDRVQSHEDLAPIKEAVDTRVSNAEKDVEKALKEAGYTDAEIESLTSVVNASKGLQIAKVYGEEILGRKPEKFTDILKESKGQILGFLAKPSTGLALSSLAFAGAVSTGGFVPLAIAGVKLAGKLHDHPQVSGMFNSLTERLSSAAKKVGVNIDPAIGGFKKLMNMTSALGKSKAFMAVSLIAGAGAGAGIAAYNRSDAGDCY